ncbi:DUF2514 family protein [Buttiauxella sp. B2]|uniref:DUF2514 family protein n=1 Tax=Buttiauxella sp. B2 TaxID=2587812 RepID=UPI001CB9CB99|nr:DUF2514 family protein [Buttiauxella sp. B2]
MTGLFKLLWKPLLSGCVITLMLWGFSHWRYQVGYLAADSAWQLKEEKRQKNDALALVSRQRQEREKERQRQDEAIKAAKEADRQIAAARTDAADAKSAGDSLRHTLDTIRKQLAGSETGRLSAIAEAGAARAETGILLANLLESADKRAGELAEYADGARIAGLTCEKTYKAVTGDSKE